MTLREVKQFMDKTVVYDGDEYTLKACLMFLNPTTAEFSYSGEIVSIKTKSVRRVPLKDIHCR